MSKNPMSRNEIVRLNLVPFGRQNITKKGYQLPDWKLYQTEYYNGGLANYHNLLCITGRIPGHDRSLVVLDFDGNQTKDDIEWIGRVLREHRLYFSKVVRTGSGGSHFYITTPSDIPIYNIHGRKLKVDWFPRCVSHVDVRGEGGIVFYPPTKFSDSPFQYTEIWNVSKSGIYLIVETQLISKFIDDIYLPSEYSTIRDSTHCAPDNCETGEPHGAVLCMRKPIRDLLSPGARNISRLSAETGMDEFLYWKVIWLEAKVHKVDTEIIFDLLEKYQPAFDKAETLRQLPHIGKKPFSNEKLTQMFPESTLPSRRNLSEEIIL